MGKNIFLILVIFCNFSCNEKFNTFCRYNIKLHEKNLNKNSIFLKKQFDNYTIYDERTNSKGGIYYFDSLGYFREYLYFDSIGKYTYKESVNEKGFFIKIDNPVVDYEFLEENNSIFISVRFFLLNKKIKTLKLSKDGQIKDVRYFKDNRYTNTYYSSVLLTNYDSSNIKNIDLKLIADIEYCDGKVEHIEEQLTCRK